MTFQVKPTALAAAMFAVVLASSAPAAAAVVVYDAVNDFHGGSSTGIWSYGTGTAGLSFTPMTTFSSVCEGSPGISCWQTPTPVDRVPLVAKNNTGATIDGWGTVVHPTDVLNVHPGPVTDAIVRFTAPISGFYTLSNFFFQTLDTNPNGVVVGEYLNNQLIGSSAFQGAAATWGGASGGKLVVPDQSGHLNAGDFVDFTVNNGGNYYNDSTGLSATFTTSVPEPASWALMIGGFGLAGAALRHRRRTASLA